jgi:transposase
LLDNNVAVHRADARKVKNFIRSFGQNAKTDNLDAKALSGGSIGSKIRILGKVLPRLGYRLPDTRHRFISALGITPGTIKNKIEFYLLF